MIAVLCTLLGLYFGAGFGIGCLAYRNAREDLDRWHSLAIGVVVGALWPAVALVLILA